ncbi:hypothetical protein PoB_007293800 [Plakobranchus ocellatus]|uniref:Uncharacterized protein n=1 Tax=Plakobranchus ocellatus TaxID=259542 RepID=A0AAV4DQU8_9GAST|nr:hypothetical protein PoB_007293800 [Plakobranchus ocellatus]
MQVASGGGGDMMRTMKKVGDDDDEDDDDDWQREILDQHLDLEQRQILRNQRMARIYLNPTKLVISPRKNPLQVQNLAERRKFRLQEHTRTQVLSRRKEHKMCAVYGVNYRDVGGLSENIRPAKRLSVSGKVCQKLRHFPPFSGPHALHMLPWEMIPGKPARERYQVKMFKYKVAGHNMEDEESKDINEFSTTPLAVWRQQRFASPEGCNFRDFKQQLLTSKYKAMLQMQEYMKKQDENVSFGFSKLTSHYKPWNGTVEATQPDQEDLVNDQVEMAAAEEEAAQMAKKMARERASMFAQHKAAREAFKEKLKEQKRLRSDPNSQLEILNVQPNEVKEAENIQEAMDASKKDVKESIEIRTESSDPSVVTRLVKSEPGGKRKRMVVRRKKDKKQAEEAAAAAAEEKKSEEPLAAADGARGSMTADRRSHAETETRSQSGSSATPEGVSKPQKDRVTEGKKPPAFRVEEQFKEDVSYYLDANKQESFLLD